MAKAKKKIGIIDFVVLGVLVVCLVLAIVGLTIDQWTTTEEVFGKTGDISFGDYSEMVVEKNEAKGDVNDALGDDIMSGLDDIFGDSELVQDAKAEEAKLDAMVAFGYITVILVAVTLALYVLKMFLKAGFFRFLVLVAGALTLISGVLAIAMTAAYCGEVLLVGAGAALLAVGGMLGGLSGVASFFFGKKKK